MPAAVHAPLINPAGFMFKERNAEPPAFTAVNGRTSPLSPQNLSGMNGMSAEPIHVRPYSRQSPERPQDQKVLPPRDEWAAVRSATDNAHHPVSPTLSDQDHSPASPTKRKRSSSAEDPHSYPSPDGHRSRMNSYASHRRDDSPNTIAQVQQLAMEPMQSRTLPPIDRPESDRGWSHNPHNGYHDMHHRDQSRDNNNSETSAMDSHNPLDRSSTTEMTRAGVQVDPKKRKRQFANRTKTGCGTCRRRKKKCDEAKPECNNCQRGGFICEGYANKIPWPKNGVQKPHPPLQAKDRFPADHAQLYHSHGTPRESYSDQNSQSDSNTGNRARPVVVEEHERKPLRNGWSGWSEPSRASYPSAEQQQQQQQQQPQQPQQPPPPPPPPSEYSQPPPPPPPTSSHGRPPSSDQPPTRGRMYHHTPQTMSQAMNHSPVVTAEAALHHQAQSQPPPPHHAHPVTGPMTAAPPAPPPTHYAPPPPRPQRSEKDKMLSGEPFQPFCPQLIEERDHCKAAVYRFNNTDNPQKDITRESRYTLFRAILAARWTRAYSESGKQPSGHYGREGVFIDTPFMCEYGYNLSIGDNVDIGTSCKFLDSGRITIGRNSSVGANVTIDTQRTPTDVTMIKGSRRTAVASEVHIGENVHIGANCTILAGVKIGSGAIVHPGSVVVRDIPCNQVARGNPADYV